MNLETKIPLLFYLLCKWRFIIWSESNIEKYQNVKRNQIVKYAASHSKFFKKLYEGYNLKDFFGLPTVNKTLMMENLSEYNTLGFKKEDLIDFALEVEKTRNFGIRFHDVNIGMSSGTSGNKGIVITTKEEENYIKAMYLSRLTFPAKEKINCAFILRVSSPAFNYNKLGNRLTYISQLQPIENMVRQLNELSPNIVSAPPSMLKILAKEAENGNLKISPKLLYSYAEVLYPDVKKYLGDVFNCRILEIYQGSEGYYGVTCKEGSLHVNEDMVFLELLEQDGNPTPLGDPCYRLLVTDLHKKSQPMIKYEINDIITLSKRKCRCGSNFRIIEKIQGRSDDLFWGIRKGINKEQFIFQDYISRAIISTSGDIEEFQAIQEKYTEIILRIKMKNGSSHLKIGDELARAIKSVFSKYDCEEPEVTVIFGDPIPNQNSNKLIRIISKIKHV
jgi:putative adenylate-forming enzyme